MMEVGTQIAQLQLTNSGVIKMIERVTNQIVHLNPSLSIDKRQPVSGIEIKQSTLNTADYLYNPQFVEKLGTSRQSISEELMLLQERKTEDHRSKAESGEEKEPSAQAASVESLKQNLIRMKSLLLEMASVAAADPDSLERIQRKLADELRGYEKAIKHVDIVEFKNAKLAGATMDVRNLTVAGSTVGSGVTVALNAVESAQIGIERAVRRIGMHTQRPRSETEAALQTADQNLAAAEATVYPDDIFERAKAVARSLSAENSAPAHIHRRLTPGDVLGLVDTDQK